jgi:lipopolysaccharide biosynthesis glycosyltransferase
MPLYNILIGCDQAYYDQWAVLLLSSIQRHNPWIQLHCHIVNPTKDNKLDNVDITSEQVNFVSDESKISYLQCVRFLAVADKFSKNERVITLDADSICTREMEKTAFEKLFKKQYVLQHHKENRWLAGFVTFNDNGFRQEYASQLNSLPFNKWKWGRDQTILSQLADTFKFKKLDQSWMAIGKNKNSSAFLTLKGEQKTKDKYLKWYNNYTT